MPQRAVFAVDFSNIDSMFTPHKYLVIRVDSWSSEMSAHLKRGALMWILGFLTFLVGLGALDALIVWEVKGQDFSFKPYLLGSVVGEISASSYLWTSLG